ncbi:hypothetical protein SAMN05216593_101508 [Pseudomonas asturiensis]|uniref:Uncharacterized protein n=1 Tax=Pseudomonas asturiensis TaxID=1190415 RepID=A0A1M7JR73_9PSED|nr:hypothetical protein [Pseudomonas asturiensis]SHM55569.1 hypothetical protein SAMN05216593_101508 [Pseudomonas asturiensis]
MTPHAQSTALEVLNRSGCPVQLRFYRGAHLIWDVWLASGSELSVPDPVHAEIDICVVFIDPVSRVTYRIRTRICSKAKRLVTRMLAEEGSVRFDLDIEPGDTISDIDVHNLCSGKVLIEARYLHSPFVLTSALDTSGSGTLNFRGVEVAAIMNGITTARIAIKDWSSDLLIDSSSPGHDGVATVSLVPHSKDGKGSSANDNQRIKA